MPKKCPPGVICVENVTLFVFVMLGISLLYIMYRVFFVPTKHSGSNTYSKSLQDPLQKYDELIIDDAPIQIQEKSPYYMKPNTFFSNMTSDVFLNPHSPPLKENRFMLMGGIYGGPQGQAKLINMQTSHYDMDYRQVGILTRQGGKQTIIPLFGRPLHSNRNKWQYYTMTENNNMIKLPVSRGGRSCTDDVGCDELFNGDNIYVEGYQDTFKTTIYENDKPRYIPYL